MHTCLLLLLLFRTTTNTTTGRSRQHRLSTILQHASFILLLLYFFPDLPGRYDDNTTLITCISIDELGGKGGSHLQIQSIRRGGALVVRMVQPALSCSFGNN